MEDDRTCPAPAERRDYVLLEGTEGDGGLFVRLHRCLRRNPVSTTRPYIALSCEWQIEVTIFPSNIDGADAAKTTLHSPRHISKAGPPSLLTSTGVGSRWQTSPSMTPKSSTFGSVIASTKRTASWRNTSRPADSPRWKDARRTTLKRQCAPSTPGNFCKSLPS